jgi:hypothetical protein
MSYSKLQFAMAALEEIGIAAYQFDVGSQEIQSAVARLDAMMAHWLGYGIRIQYPIDDPEYTEWTMQTNVPDRAWNAIITNLAIQIAPSYGKTPAQQTLANAKAGYNLLLTRRTGLPMMQLPGTMPAGAGNKPWRYYGNGPFIRPPVEPVTAGPDSYLEIQ